MKAAFFIGMKFSDTPEPLRKARLEYVSNRWEQLYKVEREAALSAINYLFLINSGGAVAILTFIGSILKNDGEIGWGLKIALILFVLGVALVGVLRARNFHFVNGIFYKWKKMVDSYTKGELIWEDMVARDQGNAVESRWEYVPPYASFGCFIGGVVIGLLSWIH